MRRVPIAPVGPPLSTACFVVSGGFAVLALVGWFADVAALTNLGLSRVSMKANTAVCLLLLSVAALVRRRVVSDVAVAVTVVLAGSVVLDYAGLVGDLGLNELLVPDDVADANLPGRMAFATASALVLVCLMLRLDPRRHRLAVDRCGAVVVGLAVLVILARIYQLPSLYGRVELTSAAPQTALALALLALGIMGSLEDGWLPRLARAPDAGAVLLRRLLVVPFVVLPLLGLLAVQGLARGWLDPAHTAAVVVVVSMALMIVASTFAAQQVSRSDRHRSSALEHLEHTNEALAHELEVRARLIEQEVAVNESLHSRGALAAEGYDRALQRIYAVGIQLHGAARREPESGFAARTPAVLSDLDEAVTELREAIKELHRPVAGRGR